MVFACRHSSRPPSGTPEFINATSENEQSASFFYGEMAKEINIPVFDFDLRQEVKQRQFIKYPEIKITTNGLLTKMLEEAELYICDHQSTTFMQAFVINTPTILFWEADLISERKEAVPLFDMLRRVDILFHDPVEAANQANSIWGDVQGWGQHSDRQNARSAFMERFCSASPNSEREWERAFKKILSK